MQRRKRLITAFLRKSLPQLFNDEPEKQVKVSSVLPQDGRETRLTVRLQKTRQAGGGANNRVEAFFAKTVDDGSIDVHAEGSSIDMSKDAGAR